MRIRVVAVMVLLAGLMATSAPAGGVADMGDVAAGRFFTEAVQWMVDEDITTGTSATCFSPDDPVTRGQAAAFMWRMEGFPDPVTDHPFTDVVAVWQQDPVSWMAENGITTGTTPSTYSPDDVLTRGQMAALVHRLAGEPKGAPPHPFTDVVRDWQQLPVSWMADEGITTGTSPTTFSPDDTVTRGQLAAFFHRYKGEPPVVVDPETPYCPTGPVPTFTEIDVEGLSLGGLAVGSLWAINETGDGLLLLDEATGQATTALPTCAPGKDLTMAIATGFGSVWFASEDPGAEMMCEIDIATLGLGSHELPAGATPTRIATDDKYVWYTDFAAGTVSRLDPGTGVVDEYDVTDSAAEPGGLKGPTGIATGFDSVWVADTLSGSIRRLDPADGTEIGFFGGMGNPYGLAVGPDAVWFTDQATEGFPPLGRIDPVANDHVVVDDPGSTGRHPREIVIGPPNLGGVWFTFQHGPEADNLIGRYVPELNQIVEYQLPTAESEPFAIAATDDAVWAVADTSDRLIKIAG